MEALVIAILILTIFISGAIMIASIEYDNLQTLIFSIVVILVCIAALTNLGKETKSTAELTSTCSAQAMKYIHYEGEDYCAAKIIMPEKKD